MAQVDGTPGVQRVSTKHVEIMNYMLLNPTHKLADVARHFGLTQPWLSCIIHSEAFQARLAEKQGEIFNGTVLPVKEKIAALAHQALDQIADRMPMMKDETVAAIADSTLDRLGFGSKALAPQAPGQASTVNVNINLRQELEDARRLIGAAPAVLPALEVMVDGQRAPIGIGGPQAIQAEGFPDVGSGSGAIPVAGSPGPGAALQARGEV